jgi:hypothetical protein
MLDHKNNSQLGNHLAGLADELENCIAPAEAALCIPPKCYTSEDHYAHEIESDFPAQMDWHRSRWSFQGSLVIMKLWKLAACQSLFYAINRARFVSMLTHVATVARGF